MQTYATSVRYPYLLLLAEHDSIVDNKEAVKWHQRTISEEKNMHEFQGVKHELVKEKCNI